MAARTNPPKRRRRRRTAHQEDAADQDDEKLIKVDRATRWESFLLCSSHRWLDIIDSIYPELEPDTYFWKFVRQKIMEGVKAYKYQVITEFEVSLPFPLF
jgi:hypothetical protein